MIERIRTFFGRTKGIHQDKTTIVAQGTAWYCNECKLVFVTKSAGDQHSCEYTFQDSIVGIKKNAETKI
jgi:hypothetical protein